MFTFKSFMGRITYVAAAAMTISALACGGMDTTDNSNPAGGGNGNGENGGGTGGGGTGGGGTGGGGTGGGGTGGGGTGGGGTGGGGTGGGGTGGGGTTSDVGRTCSEGNDCSTNLCIFSNGAQYGYCSKECESFSECPTFWDCDEVDNGSTTYCLK